MCLGVPGKVIEVKPNGLAIVDFGGGFRYEVDATTSPEQVKPGDYVIVHAGMIIAKLDPETGEEVFKRYMEIVKQLEDATGDSLEQVSL